MLIPSNGTKIGMSIWEISLTTANRLYNAAYVFLVIGAVFTAVSTIVLFWSSGVRDKFASIDIAQAHASSDQAKSTAALANEATARTTEKVASLELQTEQERARVLQLQGQLAWRSLNTEQATSLFNSANRSKSELHVQWVGGDPESLQYANQLAQPFQAAGWQVNGQALMMSDRIVFGVMVPTVDNNDCLPIKEALEAASIEYHTGPQQIPPMYFGESPKPSACILLIGSKRPPL